ncbi:hypothetical protein PP178_04015 [Zeaxanthinibacter sp. PT1]|uniref:hypothetical protein n=1 Tax=Zeaxanthinibacter TaxID=561554 RepID=UPI00234A5B96|nr:hypothetical protein [Zeaxanthinibacter sp. PT1]MDC6350706.1 hypothetical protein [Zeaxanthinibacter sp. PT1]
MPDPTKPIQGQTNETPEQVQPQGSAWDTAFDGYKKYDPYAMDSSTGIHYIDSEERETTIKEATRNTMEEGFRGVDGKWHSADKLNKAYSRLIGDDTTDNPEEKHELARVTGFSELGQSIADILGIDESKAQDANNLVEEMSMGLIPTKDIVKSLMFNTNGFVPLWDDEKKKYILQEVDMNPKDTKQATKEVMSAYGTPDRNPTWLGSLMEEYAEGVMGLPSTVANGLEAFSDAMLEGNVNYGMNNLKNIASGDLSKTFEDMVNLEKFEADPDNWINNTARRLRQNKELNRTRDYVYQDKGTFSDPVNTFSAIGQGLSSLTQYALTGGPLRKMATWGAKTVGKGFFKGTAAEIAKKQIQFANNFGSMTGGMTINTGYIMEEARANGIDSAKAGALALAVGMVSTGIEMKLGSNKLNNWLIGSKGNGTKEMMQAIAKETGGDLTPGAIEAAVKKPGVLSSLTDYFAEKATKWTPEGLKSNTGVMGNVRAAGKAIFGRETNVGNSLRTGFEEGAEEFFQSMTESTSKFIYNELLANEEDQAGAGKFAPQRFLSEESFHQAVEEFAMGAIIGGVGGIFHRESKERRDIANLVATGHTQDLLAIMQSLKDAGLYNDEQYKHYVGSIEKLDSIWKQHAPDILAAQDPKTSVNYRQKHKAAAFQSVLMEMHAQKKLDETQLELSELSAKEKPNKAERGKIQELKDKQRALRASRYAWGEKVKSFKDYRKNRYSNEIREYEMEMNYSKGVAQEFINEFKEDVAAHKSELGTLDKGTKEYTALRDKIEAKEGTLKQMRSMRKIYNSQLGKLKRKDFRARFDEKARGESKENLKSQDFALGILNRGMRYVGSDESQAGLLAKGYEIYTSPEGWQMTDADEIITEEPKEEAPKKEAPKKTPKEGKKKGDLNVEDTGGAPTGPLPGDLDKDELDALGTPPEVTEGVDTSGAPDTGNTKNTTPTSPWTQNGNPDADTKVTEGKDDSSKWTANEAPGNNPDAEPTQKKPKPKKKKVTPKNAKYPNKQEVFYNQFSSLYDGYMTAVQRKERDRIIRNPNLLEKLQFRTTDKVMRAFKVNPKNTFFPDSEIGVLSNDKIVDIEVVYMDGDTPVVLGALENPYKFSRDRMKQVPLNLSSLTFDEFTTMFNITGIGAHTPENFEKIKQEQAMLAELRKAIHQAAKDKEDGEMVVDPGAIPMKTLANFKFNSSKDEKGEQVINGLDITEAKDRNGNFVIYDKKARKYLTPSKAPQGVKPPARRSKGARYQAFMEAGGAQVWIPLSPKDAIKKGEEAAYIAELNALIAEVQALDYDKVSIVSPKVEELTEKLNEKFIALESRDMYIKFEVFKNDFNNAFQVNLWSYRSDMEQPMNKKKEPVKSIQDFNHLVNLVKRVSGVVVARENFRNSIDEELEAAPENAELFNVFKHPDIFQPTVKVDLPKVDVSKISTAPHLDISKELKTKEDKEAEEKKAEETKEIVFTSEDQIIDMGAEQGWTPERILEELEKFNNQEKNQENGAKFERVRGVAQAHSEHIINLMAAKINKYAATTTNKEAMIRKFLAEYVDGLTPQSVGITDFTDPATRFKLKTMAKERTAYAKEENIQLIIDEVKKKFIALDYNTVDLESLEDNEEGADNDWDMEAMERRMKTSKQIKEFIALTTVTKPDQYGRTMETLINYDKVYNKILHNLANTPNQETRVQKLRALAKGDPEIAAVAYRVLDTGVNPSIYKGFFTEFNKVRLDYLQTVVRKGETKVYNGIQKDAGEMLLKQWAQLFSAYSSRLTDEQKEEIIQNLEALTGYMQEGDVDLLREELSDPMKEVLEKYGELQVFKRTFQAFGVELPDTYVSGSMDYEGNEDAKLFGEREDYITPKDMDNIIDALDRWDSVRSGLFSENGQLKLFRKVANKAVPFTDDVFEKTLTDAEGKMRYAFVSPNYLLESVHQMLKTGTNENSDVLPHNYLLTLNPEIRKSMGIAFVGDIKIDRVGKVYKNLTPEEYIHNRQALFNSVMLRTARNGKGMENSAIYQPFVIAEKRSSYGIKLPINFGFFSGGKITKDAVDTFFNTVFRGEYDRMIDILRDPEIAKFYNAIKSKDGKPVTKFTVLTALNDNQALIEAIEASKDKGIEAVEAKAKKAIRKMLEAVVAETHEQLTSDAGLQSLDSSVLRFFKDGNAKASKDEQIQNYAAIFALNDMLVRASVQEMIQGDAAITKNEIDRVKRAAGLNAAGVPVIDRAIKVAYKTDGKATEIAPETVNRGKSEYDEEGKLINGHVSDSDDAVVYVTAQYRMEMDSHMGRLTQEQERIYQKVIDGEKLKDWEVKKIDLISAKTVHYTPEIYNKKSDVVLTKEMTSYKKNGKWVARKGFERLHNMREWMEKNEVDQLVTLNATKGVKNDAIEDSFFSSENFGLDKDVPLVDSNKKSKALSPSRYDAYMNSTMLDGRYERLQVENASKSAKGVFTITHPTQIIELIAAELSDVPGAPSVRELKERMDSLRAGTLKENVDLALKYLLREDEKGDLNISDFIEKAKQTLEAAQEKEEVLKYLVDENGKFKYNMNIPHVALALKKIMVSHTNKGTLADKMPGAKVTIVPSTAIQGVVYKEIKNEDGNIIGEELADPVDVIENPQNYEGEEWKSRDLKVHNPDREGETALAEVMITRRSANLMGLKPGDTIPPEALEIFGVRIPSQWYHSMIAAKVVGFLPDTHGDIAVLPKEMPLIAGEDFDVDSRFLMIKEGYWVKNEDGTREYKLYGSATTVDGRWDEYYRYNSQRKEIKISVSNALSGHPEYNSLVERFNKLREAIKNDLVDTDLLDDELISDELNEMDLSADNFLGWSGDRVSQVESLKEAIGSLKADTIKAIESLNEDIQAIKDQATLDAFKAYGLLDSKLAFMQAKDPVIVPANKNELISTYIEMFTHKSIQDRLKVPASLDGLVEDSKWLNSLWGNTNENGSVKEGNSMLISPVGAFNAWYNNVSGAANIGNVASTNSFIAYATKMGLKSQIAVNIDGTDFSSFAPTMEHDIDQEGNPIENREFKWDTISSLITAMTDNAKERLASKLNMKRHFVSQATLMAGMGIGRRRINLFFHQPALMHLDVQGKNSVSDEIIDEAIGAINALLDDVEIKDGGLTSKDMLRSVKFNKMRGGKSRYQALMELGEVQGGDIDFLITQLQVLQQFKALMEINQGVFAVQDVLNVKKGFKDVRAPRKVAESWDNINAVHPESGEPLFIFDNAGSVMNQDKVVREYVRSADAIGKAWRRHLIDSSTAFLNMEEEYPHIEAISEEMMALLVSRAFRQELMSQGVDISKKAHLLFPSLTGQTLVDQFEALLKSDPTFAANEFIKRLDVKRAGGRSKIDVLGVDTFAKYSPATRNAVEEGFDELWNSTDSKVQEFAQNALFYLIQKDNFKFKNDSFVAYLAPDMISNVLKRMDGIQKAYLVDSDQLSEVGASHSMLVGELLDLLAHTNKDAFRFLKPERMEKLKAKGATKIAQRTKKGLRLHVSAAAINADKRENLAAPDKESMNFHKYINWNGVVYELEKESFDTDADEPAYFVNYKRVKPINLGGASPLHLSLDEAKALADSLPNDKITTFAGMAPASAYVPEPGETTAPDKDLDDKGFQFDPNLSFVMPDKKDTPPTPPPSKDDDDIPNLPDLDDSNLLFERRRSASFDPETMDLGEAMENFKGKKVSLTELLSYFKPGSAYLDIAKKAEELGITLIIEDHGADAYGIYHPGGEIQLNPRVIGAATGTENYGVSRLEQTLVHEMLHGIIEKLPKNKRAKMMGEVEKFVEDLKQYEGAMSAEVRESFQYIKNDPEELITYAFTNEPFANFLASVESDVKVDGKKQSFWERLKKLILDRIPASLKNSKLAELSQILDNVLGYNPLQDDAPLDLNNDEMFDLKFERARTKPFSVSPQDSGAIRAGSKKMSYIQPHEVHSFKKGDTLDIISKRKSTGSRVKVKAVKHVPNFSKLPQDQKDRAAQLMNGFESFDEMMTKMQFDDPRSLASIQFPALREFVMGDSEGYLMEYGAAGMTTDELVDEARAKNPAKDPMKNLLEMVETELTEQIDALETSDLKDGTYKSNRMKRLKDMREKVVNTEDLLAITDGALEDLKATRDVLNKRLENLKEGTPVEDIISELFKFRRLVESYKFLDKIVSEEKKVIANSNTREIPDPSGKLEELRAARDLRNEIQDKLLKEIEPLIAEQFKVEITKQAQQQLRLELDEARQSLEDLEQEHSEKPDMSDDKKSKQIEVAQKRIANIQDAYSKAALDEADIIALLNNVEKDIPYLEYLMGAASQSSDPLLAMYSLFTKRNHEISRRKTIKAANKVQEVMDRFKKKYSGMNLEKIYEDIYEEVNTGGKDQVQFTDRVDMKAFKEARDLYMTTIDRAAEKKKIQAEIDRLTAMKGKKPYHLNKLDRYKVLMVNNDELNRYLIEQWYVENTKPKSDDEIREVLDEIRDTQGWDALVEFARDQMNNRGRLRWGILTKEEFKAFGKEGETKKQTVARLMKEGKFGYEIYYKKEFKEPIDKYLNLKWLKMYNSDGTPKNLKGEMHKVLLDTYLASQRKLPIHERQGLLLPGIYKKAKDRFTEGENIIEIIKREANEMKENYMGENLAEDVDYSSDKYLGGNSHQLPVYYQNTLEAADTSLDLARNILMYEDMANTYQARVKSMETGMFLLDKFKSRTINQQNSFFRNLYDKTARKLGHTRQLEDKKGSRYTEQRLEKFIQMVVFGDANQVVKLGNVRVDKIVSTLMMHASFTSFGLHADALSRIFMGATANMNQQLIQQTIEASGEGDMSVKDILKGQELFTRMGKQILIEDFGKSGNKSKIGQFIDLFDVIQGEFRDTLGRRISGSKARQLMSTDALFVHRHLTEYEPQVAFFLARAYKTMVKDKDGNEINLLEAYGIMDSKGNLTSGTGELKLQEGVEWNVNDEIKFMNRMHAVNKMLNGVYNSYDKSVLEYSVWGKMLMFFRKYLYPSMRRRWGSQYIDYEQDQYQRGYALYFWRAMRRELYHYRRSFPRVMKGNDLSTREKQEAVKSLVSFGIGFSNMLVAMAIKNIIAATDDEDDVVLNYMLYNALRMQAETWSFWNPQEFMRIMRSPTILTTHIERISDFAVQFGSPFEEYQRDTGTNEKGDSKLYARFVKLALGQTAYSESPKTAVKVFESFTN